MDGGRTLRSMQELCSQSVPNLSGQVLPSTLILAISDWSGELGLLQGESSAQMVCFFLKPDFPTFGVACGGLRIGVAPKRPSAQAH